MTMAARNLGCSTFHSKIWRYANDETAAEAERVVCYIFVAPAELAHQQHPRVSVTGAKAAQKELILTVTNVKEKNTQSH